MSPHTDDFPLDESGAVIPGLVEHLSPSAVSTYLRCPRQYWWRYIMGKKSPPGAALMKGISAHRGIEVGLQHKIDNDQEVPPLDLLLDATRDEAGKQLKEGELDKGEAPGEVIDRSVQHVKEWHRVVAPDIHPVETEQFFREKIAGVLVVGRIDTVEIIGKDKDGTPVRGVRDWKTKSKKPSALDVYREPQGGFYPFVTGLASMNFTYLVERPKGSEIIPIVLPTGIVETNKSLVEDQVRDIAYAVRAGVFPRNRNGWWCSRKFCGYYDQCIFGKEGP